MKTLLGALGVSFLTVGVLTVPTAALADTPADPVKVVALVDHDDAGRSKTYPIHPGEFLPVVIGVADVGTAPTKVVLNVRVFDDVNLPKSFDNCWYYGDSNLEGAWCEFDQELAVGTTYEASQFFVAAASDAKADKVGAITEGWLPLDWAEKQGGIEALAKKYGQAGSTPVQGSGATLSLKPRTLTIPDGGLWVAFAYLKLIDEPTTGSPVTPSSSLSVSPSPGTSTSASASASASPSLPPSADPGPTGGTGGGDGGGLPVTGAKAATIAGGGAGLLIAGLVGFVLARRRRTRFIA